MAGLFVQSKRAQIRVSSRITQRQDEGTIINSTFTSMPSSGLSVPISILVKFTRLSRLPGRLQPARRREPDRDMIAGRPDERHVT
jgi:hypothetical protein